MTSRVVKLLIHIETEATDEELDELVSGIDAETLGIGQDAEGNPINEQLIWTEWQSSAFTKTQPN